MRVLMTTDTVGGAFAYCVELIAALQAYGVEVVLATMGSPLTAAQRTQLCALHGLSLHESSFALEWMDEPWQQVDRASQWLQELARTHEPDVIHLNHCAFGQLDARAPVLMVAHSCVLSFWRAVHGEPVPARYARYRERVGAGLRRASRVIVSSHAMLDDLQRTYGPLPDCAVIPNGIALGAFKPAHKEPIVFSAGRLWDAAKNLRALRLSAVQLPWPVRVAADARAPSSEAYELAPCEALGTLSRSALVQELAQAAIYALPARYEPSGLSVLEAAASGCALVLGRLPNLIETWHDAACFIDPEQPQELERELHRLIESPELRAQLAEQALVRSRDFSAARMAQAYVEQYVALGRSAPVEAASCEAQSSAVT